MTDDAPNAWDRRDDETAKAFDAFAVYRDLGSGRSLVQVALELDGDDGKPAASRRRPRRLRQVERWSAQHDWPARARAWDIYQDRLAQEAFTAETLRRARQHAAEATRLQALALADAEGAEPMSRRDAVLAYERAVKIERTARGMTTEVTETRHADADGNTLAPLAPEQEALRFAAIADILRTIPPAPSPEDEGSPDADG